MIRSPAFAISPANVLQMGSCQRAQAMCCGPLVDEAVAFVNVDSAPYFAEKPEARASFSSSASTCTGGARSVAGSSRGSSPSGSPRSLHAQAAAHALAPAPMLPPLPPASKLLEGGALPPHLAIAAPGDVVSVVTNEGIANVGAVGGLMGHVLLVASEPSLVQPDSAEAQQLEAEWGDRCRFPLLRVAMVESTREAEGLHEHALYLHVDEHAGTIHLVGEFSEAHGYMEYNDDNTVEVWRAPRALREQFRMDLMVEVLAEMRRSMASWSYATAARALLRKGEVDFEGASEADAYRILRELRGCWAREPICTSVVVIFWQRYLCALVGLGPNTRVPPRREEVLTAVRLILTYMPLMADRTLPAELRTALRLRCGWAALRKPGHAHRRYGRHATL